MKLIEAFKRADKKTLIRAIIEATLCLALAVGILIGIVFWMTASESPLPLIVPAAIALIAMFASTRYEMLKRKKESQLRAEAEVER